MKQQKGLNPKDKIGSTKPPIHLVPASAVIGIAMAMKNGADKYGPYNFRDPNFPVLQTTYLSAAIRHIMCYLDGEEVAEDSGVDHLSHAMASLAILFDAVACGNAVDDRPTQGRASQLIEWFKTK